MPTVDEMRIVLDAETARFAANLMDADRRMAQFERSTSERLRRFDTYFRSAGAAVGALGLGLGAREVAEFAAAWGKLTATLQAAGPVFGDGSQDRMMAVLNASRLGVEQYGGTVVSLAASMRGYGLTADDAATATQTLANALKLGGLDGGDHASAMKAFADALAGGKVEGEGLARSLRFARGAQAALAAEAGVSRDKVLAMVRDGEIGAETFVRAMVRGAAEINRAYGSRPASVTESMAVLRNSVVSYVGKLDEAIGGSRTISALMEKLAANMDTVAGAAVVLGAAMLAAFGPSAVAAVGRLAVGVGGAAMGAAALAGPLGVVAAIVGGGAAAIGMFGDKVAVTADGMVTMKDTALAVIDVIGGQLTPMFDQASALWDVAVQKIKSALDGLPISFDDVASAARQAVNSIIGVYAFAAHAIVAAFITLPPAIAEQFIVMANKVIEIVEGMVRGVVEMLNVLPGIKITPEVDLGRLSNPLEGAGAMARDAMRSAGGQLGRDFVGEFSAATSGVRDAVAKRAREIADARRAAARSAGGDGQFDRPTSSGRDMTEAIRRASEQVEAVYRKALEATGRYREAVVEEYERDLRKFQDLLDKKLISQEQFDRARTNLAIVAAQQMNEAAEKEFKKLREVTDVVAGAMGSAFDTFVRTGKFSFADFSRSIIADLAKIAFKMAIIQPLFGQSGQGFGLIGGGLTDLFGGIFGGARAAGGPVDAGRAYLVGEKGPELFVPRMPGGIVPNGAAPVMAGGGSSINIAFNVTSPDAEGFRQSQSQIAAMLSRAVGRGQRNL